MWDHMRCFLQQPLCDIRLVAMIQQGADMGVVAYYLHSIASEGLSSC